MARVNVYLPDELAERAKTAGLNVSNLTQEALRSALAARRTDDWLDDISRLRATGVSHNDVIEAVNVARDEFDRDHV
ncbi:MAG TPA: antitoxin [Actinobacteria bacterium]|nr:antitoxin [Actinomycetota bacterium]